MLPTIRRWIVPPIFTDEEKTRIAGLLNGLLLAIAFICLLDAGALLVFAPETIPTFWLNGLGIAICGGLIWMMRRGNVLLASRTLCFVLWALLAFYLSESGGVQSPAVGFLIVTIVIGTVLLGPRGTIIVGILCALTLIGLYAAGTGGLLTSIEGPPSMARLFGTNISITVAISLLMVIGGRSVLDALARARMGEQILAERNQQLQNEITERQRAEQVGQRLISILENTTDVISMADPVGKIIYLNRAGRKLLGVDEQEDISGTTTVDYYPPSALEYIRKVGLPIAMQEGTWPSETMILTRDKREIPISQVVVAHLNAAGAVEYFSTIIRDITESKRAEETLTNQRNLLRTVIDALPDYVYAKDIDSRFTLSNEALARSVGKSPDELIGKIDFDFFPKELADNYFTDEQSIMNSGQSLIQREERGIARDGSLIWASTTKVPLRDGQAKIVGLVGITRDITERKRAEEALAQERKLLRTVIDHLPINIFVKDRDGNFVLNNAESMRILEVSQQEQLNGKSDFDFFPRELAEKWHAEEQGVMQSGQSILEVEEIQPWRTDKRIWIVYSLIPLRDEHGRVFGMVGINRDITDRKKAEEALRTSEERYRMISELISDHAFSLQIKPDGQLVYEWYTHSLSRITGYTNEELLRHVNEDQP